MAQDYSLLTEVREMIGETIPEGGSDADTMFPDARVQAWIDSTSSSQGAALKGWHAKLANYSGLVDVTDGASSRMMSDFMANAKTMVSLYTKLAVGPSAGRTRVGKIRRP